MKDLIKLILWFIPIFLAMVGILALCIYFFLDAEASEVLTASWYSIQSLKTEGTYKYSKGVMANGKPFVDDAFTCATRLFPLGSLLRVTNLSNQKSVEVKVTDRIGKRFAKTRVDLSKKAFAVLAPLSQGLIQVKVERLK